jgi:shikimate kinase
LGKKNVVLAGFMASGKSTVGRILSDLTGMRLVETDFLVEGEAGVSIREIFRSRGEERFRLLERRAVERAAGMEDVVISAGGGAVLDPVNVDRLKRAGVIYLLGVTADEALRRAGGTGARPLLGKKPEEVEGLLDRRSAAYREAADVVVETVDRSAEEVALQIKSDFEKRRSGYDGGARDGNG